MAFHRGGDFRNECRVDAGVVVMSADMCENLTLSERIANWSDDSSDFVMNQSDVVAKVVAESSSDGMMVERCALVWRVVDEIVTWIKALLVLCWLDTRK